MTIFIKNENPWFTWTGYGDDVIGHDRNLKKVQPNTNCLQITMQKELGRHLLPVSRKKYKTDHHLKKYPPKLPRNDHKLWIIINILGGVGIDKNAT